MIPDIFELGGFEGHPAEERGLFTRGGDIVFYEGVDYWLGCVGGGGTLAGDVGGGIGAGGGGWGNFDEDVSCGLGCCALLGVVVWC